MHAAYPHTSPSNWPLLFGKYCLCSSEKVYLRKCAASSPFKNVTFKDFKKVTLEEMEKRAQEAAGTGSEDKNEDTAQVASKALSNAPIYFYHPDHLGTSNALTDANGTMYQFFLNLPFGETMASQSSTSYYQSEFKFNGKELDTETGLYYYGARYYDPSLSVWLSVDPLAEQFPSFLPYNYTMNNPINMVDPDGRAPDVVHEPLDWIKNLKTGRVRWINASGNTAIVGAAQADGRIEPSSVQTDVSSDIKKDYKNLGSDFFATGDTIGDYAQMKAEQLKYISEVASKLEKNAGLDGGLGDANSLPLNYTVEKLKSILMGGKSSSSSNRKSTIDEIINFGKSEIQNHYRDEAIEKILNVSGRTVATAFMLFESQDVGRGSDMSATNNLRNQNLFNSRIAPQLDPMTVFKIRLHKY